MFLKAKRHSGPILYLELDRMPIAKTGEEFRLKARYRFMNDPIEYRDYFRSTIQVPTSKFIFRIVFEGDTPPKSCILSHCKSGITTKSLNWTKVRRGQIFEHREINPSVGTEVRADWIW